MRRLAFAALCSLLPALVLAQGVEIPPDLKAWESWVMHGEEFRRCPITPGSPALDASAFTCVWPGRLRVAVGATGGEFEQHWQVYAGGWVSLPGENLVWPERVQVDGKPASVVPRGGLP